MTTQFEKIAECPGFKMGAFGPVALSVYSRGVSAQALNLLDARQAELIKVHPKLFTFTVVMGDSLTPPPSEVRQLAATLQGKYAATSTGAAVVFAVSGLAAIIARAFMTALSLVAPPTMNQKTFRNVAEAVEWARSIPGQLPEARAPDMKQAIELFVNS